MKTARIALAAFAATSVAFGASADDNVTISYEEEGKYFTADDIPTFNVSEDGTVDWYTFPASAAITPNAMSATARMARGRPMPRSSSNRRWTWTITTSST